MWSDEDEAWLKTYYPGLKIKDPRTIEGQLSFQMLHSEGTHYVRPSSDLIATHSDAVYLCDSYRVRIVLNNNSLIPATYEVDGRIIGVAARLGKAPIDLHLYDATGALCLASDMEFERTFNGTFSLPTFIDEFVVPYFFAQSYYELHEKWLWGELGHGYKGLLQWLGRTDDYSDEDIQTTYRTLMAQEDAKIATRLLKERCRSHKPCPCGSGFKTRDCCPDIKEAIARLRAGLHRGIIEPTSLPQTTL